MKNDPIYRYFGSTEPVKIENRNIKYLFKAIHNFGLKEGIISRINRLDFNVGNGDTVTLEIGTVFGDLASSNRISIPKIISSKLLVEEITIKDIENWTSTDKVPVQPLFDSLGNINPLIKQQADTYGVNLSHNKPTVQSSLMYKSNDYTELDSLYAICTGATLAGTNKSKYNSAYFEPISIIIPSYNSEDSLPKVLAAIQSQDITKSNKQMIEVIVVDDGSDKRIIDYISDTDYDFRLKVIRLEKNLGLSTARNTGTHASTSKYLFFIDSDILLSKNYLYEHLIRLKTMPNTILLSLKQNISPDSNSICLANIKKGINPPLEFDDKRLIRKQKKNTPWINKVSSSGFFEILSESNYFASFGNGRIINGYDLPSAVVGHNMSMSRVVFEIAGGFSHNFIGWGLEDTYFGARAIAEGCFVIPVVSTGVYHIDHPIRQVNKETKMSEYRKNIKTYKKLLEEEI